MPDSNPRPFAPEAMGLAVSSAASDTSAIVGTMDIVMIPSIVDVAGISRTSRIIYARESGSICGMIKKDADVLEPFNRSIHFARWGGRC